MSSRNKEACRQLDKEDRQSRLGCGQRPWAQGNQGWTPWQSTCLACTRPCILFPTLQKRKWKKEAGCGGPQVQSLPRGRLKQDDLKFDPSLGRKRWGYNLVQRPGIPSLATLKKESSGSKSSCLACTKRWARAPVPQ